MISESDVFSREFNWKILDLRWSFSAGLSKQHSKCPKESFERFNIEKIFQVNFTFLETTAVGFSDMNLACRAFYFEKNCLSFWKTKTLLFNFGFGTKKICRISKIHRMLRLKLHWTVQTKVLLKSLGKKFWDFCPNYNRKIVKSGFYVSRIFLCGNFFRK